MEQILNSQQIFPVGTTVKAYPASNWATFQLPPTGAPKGASVSEGVVAASGAVTLGSLNAGTRYFAAGEVGGQWRYVGMVPSPSKLPQSRSESEAKQQELALALEQGLPGVIPGNVWPGTTSAMAANRSFYNRFQVARRRTLKIMRFVVTTAAGVSDSLEAGIYNSKLERLVSSGAVAPGVNAQGVKAIEFTPFVCEPGVTYFAALAYGALGGTAPQLAAILSNIGYYGDIFGATLANRMQLFANESFPLPAGPVVPVGGTSSPWIVPAEA